MRGRWLFCLVVMITTGACRQAPVTTEEATPDPGSPGGVAPAAPESETSAPNSAFRPIEPTEAGIIGAPTIWTALAPLGTTVPEGEEGSPTLTVRARRAEDMYVADVVRTGLLDDSIGADHVRIEFRREPEGWFPTNAFRRQQCRRGAEAGQWSAAPCP